MVSGTYLDTPPGARELPKGQPEEIVRANEADTSKVELVHYAVVPFVAF